MDKNDIEKNIKKLLAEHVGTEPDEINTDYSLKSDLHMNASDISDFLGKMEESDIDTSKIDLTEVDTVGDIIESLE